MPLPIALQFYTVRDALAKDLAGTCRAVAEMGYTHAEIGPFGGHTTAEVAQAVRAVGLEVIASHEMGLTGEHAAETVEMARRLGLPFVVQPWLDAEQRTEAGYTDTGRRLGNLSVEGTVVCYHNHEFEFTDLGNGLTGWEALFAEPSLHAEMDTCWVEVAGQSAVDWLRRLEGRVPLVHLKDCSDYEQKTLCEIGTGKVPIAAIAQAAEEAGAEYLIVEQDDNWIDGDPIKSARLSFENLQKLL